MRLSLALLLLLQTTTAPIQFTQSIADSHPLTWTYENEVVDRAFSFPEHRTELLALHSGDTEVVGVTYENGATEAIFGRPSEPVNVYLHRRMKQGKLPVDPWNAANELHVKWDRRPLPVDEYFRIRRSFLAALNRDTKDVPVQSTVTLHAAQFQIEFIENETHLRIKLPDGNSALARWYKEELPRMQSKVLY